MSAQTEPERLDIEDVQTILDTQSFRPFGQARWMMTAYPLEDLGADVIWNSTRGEYADPSEWFGIVLEHWVANSRGFDHWDEFASPEIHPQTFSGLERYPFAGQEREFKQAILERCLNAISHEACEWFVDGDTDEILYDPHVEGDPTVSL